MRRRTSSFRHVAGNERDACFGQVEECAQRIVQLDDGSAYGPLFDGLLRWKRDGDPVGALDTMRAAAQSGPNDPLALFWTVLHAAACGHDSTAAASAARLVDVDPRASRSHWSVGWHYLLQGNYAAAAQAFAQAYRLDPMIPPVRFFRAYSLAATERRDDAYAIFDEMIKEKEKTSWTWLGRFYRHTLASDRRKALRAITPELKQAAREDELYSLLVAECFALTEEKAQSLEWLENAIRRGFIHRSFLEEHAPFLGNVREEERFGQLIERGDADWQLARGAVVPTPR